MCKATMTKYNIYYDVLFLDDKISYLKTIIDHEILIVIDDEEYIIDFAIENLDAYAFLFNSCIKYFEYKNIIRVG